MFRRSPPACADHRTGAGDALQWRDPVFSPHTRPRPLPLRPFMPRISHRPDWLAWLFLLLACVLPLAAHAAGSPLAALALGAQADRPLGTLAAAPASAALAQSLDQVIATLQNDIERQNLLNQLQTLRRGVRRTAPRPPLPPRMSRLRPRPRPDCLAPSPRPSRKSTRRRARTMARGNTGAGASSSPGRNGARR